MARVPYVSRQQLPSEHRGLLDRENNLQRALANHPSAMQKFMAVNRWLRYGAGLDPRLRELGILQVGYVLGNAYEFSHHLKLAPEFGVSPADIDALVAETRNEPTLLGAVDRAVLQGARELTVQATISDDCWSVLEGSLEVTELMELVLAVSYYNHIVRVIGALRIDLEPEYALLLEPYDPPPPLARWR